MGAFRKESHAHRGRWTQHTIGLHPPLAAAVMCSSRTARDIAPLNPFGYCAGFGKVQDRIHNSILHGYLIQCNDEPGNPINDCESGSKCGQVGSSLKGICEHKKKRFEETQTGAFIQFRSLTNFICCTQLCLKIKITSKFLWSSFFQKTLGVHRTASLWHSEEIPEFS